MWLWVRHKKTSIKLDPESEDSTIITANVTNERIIIGA